MLLDLSATELCSSPPPPLQVFRRASNMELGVLLKKIIPFVLFEAICVDFGFYRELVYLYITFELQYILELPL